MILNRSHGETCAGKIPYCLAAAKRALRSIQRQREIPDWDRMEWYPCTACGKYHLGHSPFVNPPRRQKRWTKRGKGTPTNGNSADD